MSLETVAQTCIHIWHYKGAVTYNLFLSFIWIIILMEQILWTGCWKIPRMGGFKSDRWEAVGSTISCPVHVWGIMSFIPCLWPVLVLFLHWSVELGAHSPPYYCKCEGPAQVACRVTSEVHLSNISLESTGELFFSCMKAFVHLC